MTELNVFTRKADMSLDTLRAEGKVPGVCYGAGMENTLVSFSDGDFRKLYRDAGTSSVITLTGDLAGKQCFVQEVQTHPVTGDVLHVDFKIVSANETTEVDVPVELQGEAPAVHKKLGILYVAHQELAVEAIPSKVPAEILVDISGLEEVGDNIRISDLPKMDGVTFLDDPETTIVSVTGLQEEKEETGPTMEEVLAEPKKEEGEAEEKQE